VKLRNVASLYLVRLRGRMGQELLALVGIAVGVSLLFAALVANTSLTGSFERLTNRIVGDARLQLTARGSGTLDDRMLAEARRLPGVARAAAALEERGEVGGPGGSRSVQLIGVTPQFAGFGGTFDRGFSYGFLAGVRALALPTPLVNSLDLALGQPVVFYLNGRRVEARLGAKLQGSDIGSLVDTPVAIAPLRYAQELTDQPDRISRVFVVPKPGADAQVEAGLRRLAAGRADVRPANFDAALFRQASLPTSQSTTMFSVFGAMVGFLFAFSAMLLTAPQRRRMIVDLTTEGYGRTTVLRVLLFDALVLGVVASALGILLGDQIARLLFDETPSFLQYAFAVGPSRTVELGNVAIAALGGIVASCVAVIGPTLGALRRQDDGSTGSAGGASRRTWLVAGGLGALLAGIGIALAEPASAALGIAGLVCLTASMLMLLPALLRLLVEGLDLLTRGVRSVVPFLAIFDLRDPSAQARSLAVAATGAIAVFGSVALQGAHADLLRGLDQTSHDVAGLGDLWAIAPGGANLLVTTPFKQREAATPPGLERVETYRGGFLDVGDRRVRVLAPPRDGPQPLSSVQVLEGDEDAVDERLSEGGWIVLSEGVAHDLGVEVGDSLTLPAPVPTRLRVAALSTNLGWPPGAIVLNADDYARAWGSEDASALLATLDHGTTPAEGRAALREALGSGSQLTVYTASERVRDQDAASRAGVERLAQIAALVLLSAVIAMASAMAGLIWQRRSFLAGVKVEGYGTAALWKALLLEAAILIGVGCATGAVFGLLGQGLLSRALTSVTGFPVVYSLAAVGAILTCLAVTVAAVAIVALFGQRAASVAPESALGE
jgi:putative ABC transport system permease protein